MQPFPKFVGALAVVVAALAGVGHEALVTVFGEWGAAFVPVASAVIAAFAHSLTGTGGK